MININSGIQPQNQKVLNECCICRQEILNDEEIIICSSCQTIYHYKHLSIWLKIRKKCPICKNIFRNRLNSIYTENDDGNSFIRDNTTLTTANSFRRMNRGIIAKWNSIVLECPNCKSISEFSTSSAFIKCKACGSNISWRYHLNSKILSLNEANIHRSRKIWKNKDISKQDSRKIEKRIQSRNIERLKKVERGILQSKPENQLQKEILSEIDNGSYLSYHECQKDQDLDPNHNEYSSIKIIKSYDKKEHLEKINSFEHETIIALIIVAIYFILIFIIYTILKPLFTFM